jgi:hypothetical protein
MNNWTGKLVATKDGKIHKCFKIGGNEHDRHRVGGYKPYLVVADDGRFLTFFKERTKLLYLVEKDVMKIVTSSSDLVPRPDETPEYQAL